MRDPGISLILELSGDSKCNQGRESLFLKKQKYQHQQKVSPSHQALNLPLKSCFSVRLMGAKVNFWPNHLDFCDTVQTHPHMSWSVSDCLQKTRPKVNNLVGSRVPILATKQSSVPGPRNLPVRAALWKLDWRHLCTPTTPTPPLTCCYSFFHMKIPLL